jgi:hypothetical protein
MQQCYSTFLITIIGVLSPAFAAESSSNLALPEALASAISNISTNSSVVGAEDVDPSACRPVGEKPGLVQADFNGDGRDDYAVLLKTKETDKKTTWQGTELREAEFAFAFLLDDASGGYKQMIVRRYSDFVPTGVVLDLQAPGDVHDRETHKDIQIFNPSVILSFCEKSATAYFVTGGEIHSIPIAD